MENKVFKAKKRIYIDLETKKYGIIVFDTLSIWRESILQKFIKNYESIEPKDLVNYLARATLLKINDQTFSYESFQKNPEILINFKLELSDTELTEFAHKFAQSNEYLFGKNGVEIGFDNGPLLIFPDDQELIEKKWPENIFEKIKEAWILYENKQRKWIKEHLGISNIKNLDRISTLINNDNQINNILKSSQNFVLQHSSQSSLDISDKIEIDELNTYEEEILSNKILETLENLFSLQKSIHNFNQESSRLTNVNLEEQVKISRNSSKTSTYFSASAIFISSISLFLSIYFGIRSLNQKHPLEDLLINTNNILENINFKLENLNIINENLKKIYFPKTKNEK